MHAGVTSLLFWREIFLYKKKKKKNQFFCALFYLGFSKNSQRKETLEFFTQHALPHNRERKKKTKKKL